MESSTTSVKEIEMNRANGILTGIHSRVVSIKGWGEQCGEVCGNGKRERWDISRGHKENEEK